MVDCSDFQVLSDLEDACWRMWKDVAQPCPSSTTRNAVRALLRARLGPVPGRHGLSPEVLDALDRRDMRSMFFRRTRPGSTRISRRPSR